MNKENTRFTIAIKYKPFNKMKNGNSISTVAKERRKRKRTGAAAAGPGKGGAGWDALCTLHWAPV